jgi:hypothetical protein
MRFKLYPVGNPDNRFWSSEPTIVDIPDHAPSSGPIKLSSQPFIPEVSLPAPAPDPFAGLGEGSAYSSTFEFAKIELVPLGRPDYGILGDDDPISTEYSFEKIRPALSTQGDDAAFAGLGATRIDGGEAGTFRKSARQLAVGDPVRLRRSLDKTSVIREVRPNGTVRCDEEGYPAGLGISPHNLSRKSDRSVICV